MRYAVSDRRSLREHRQLTTLWPSHSMYPSRSTSQSSAPRAPSAQNAPSLSSNSALESTVRSVSRDTDCSRHRVALQQSVSRDRRLTLERSPVSRVGILEIACLYTPTDDTMSQWRLTAALVQTESAQHPATCRALQVRGGSNYRLRSNSNLEL